MTTQKKEMRAVYAETLVELAKDDDSIVVLEADLMKASGTGPFLAAFPDRCFNLGVAEANMVGVAAGLSSEGKIPFATTFGCFASRRAFDQFFVSCAYARLNVKLIGTDPGVSAALNGGTHMPFEDLALMRSVPGIAVIEPSDAASLHGLLGAMARRKGSVYMRLHRKAVPDLYPADERFEIGKAKLLRKGDRVVIVALGPLMVGEALKAADALAAEGISASVIDALTLKPLDTEMILTEARRCGAVVTAENHQIIGGLGSAVAELLAETGVARLARVGIQDEFGEVGTQDYLMDRFRLRAERIVELAKGLVTGDTHTVNEGAIHG